MPRKAYLSDLQSVAEQTQLDGILNIRPGGESGQFLFDLQLQPHGPTYEITVLVSGQYLSTPLFLISSLAAVNFSLKGMRKCDGV